MKKRLLKKSCISLLLVILSAGYVGIITKADTGKYSSMNWYSYNGNGVLDGSDNGVFYSLTPGNVSFVVDSTSASSNYLIYLNLKRARTGFDADYGSVTLSGAYTQRWYVDTSSSDYYIKAYSFNYNRYENANGTMHDHY